MLAYNARKSLFTSWRLLSTEKWKILDDLGKNLLDLSWENAQWLCVNYKITQKQLKSAMFWHRIRNCPNYPKKGKNNYQSRLKHSKLFVFHKMTKWVLLRVNKGLLIHKTILFVGGAKNTVSKIILEGKTTCRHHRMTPQKTGSGKILTNGQRKTRYTTCRFFLSRFSLYSLMCSVFMQNWHLHFYFIFGHQEERSSGCSAKLHLLLCLRPRQQCLLCLHISWHSTCFAFILGIISSF